MSLIEGDNSRVEVSLLKSSRDKLNEFSLERLQAMLQGMGQSGRQNKKKAVSILTAKRNALLSIIADRNAGDALYIIDIYGR